MAQVRSKVLCAFAIASMAAPSTVSELQGTAPAANVERELSSDVPLPPPPPVIPVSSSSAGGWGYPGSYATPELISYDDIELFPRWTQDPDTQIWEYKIPIPNWDYSYTFDDPDGTCSHKCSRGDGMGDFPYYGLDYCHQQFDYYKDNCMDYYHPVYHPWIFVAPPAPPSSSAVPPSSGAPPVRRDLCGLECKYGEEDHHGKRSPLGRYLLTDEGGDYHRELGACPPCPDRGLQSSGVPPVSSSVPIPPISSSAAPIPPVSSAVPIPPPPLSGSGISSSAGPLSYYHWWEPTWPTDDKKYCHFYYSVCGATVAYHLSGTFGTSSGAPPIIPSYPVPPGPPISSSSFGAGPIIPGIIPPVPSAPIAPTVPITPTVPVGSTIPPPPPTAPTGTTGGGAIATSAGTAVPPVTTVGTAPLTP